MNIREIALHFVCPPCGKKLSKVGAMEHATINIRRKCGRCHRWWSITIRPIAIRQGWAHSATLTEYKKDVAA